MTSPISREILVDVLHNRGTTRDQVRHRIINYSPHEVNRIIEVLISRGYLQYHSHKLEITREGLESLYAHRKEGVPA